MQKKTTSRWAAVSTVLFFLALLLWGAVANSDFPLGIYGPPEGNHLPNWADFGDLNANRSFNYNLAYYNTLSQYLDSVDAQSMKAVLRLYGGCGYPWNDRDFLMEYYSQGQRWVYEVEQRYSDAEYMLNTQTQRNPDGFYHFSHKDDGEQDDRGEIDPNAPTGGASWVCFKNSDTDGVMLIGPRETVNDEDALGGFRAQTGYPRWASPDTLYPFQSIIHLRADTTQCSTQQDSVFRLEVIQKRRTYSGSSYQYFTIFDSVFTPETIGTNDWTEIDSLFYSVFDHSKYNHGSTWVYYKLTWYDNCDFWVDYIEFMDMERGKYLFTSDAIRTEKTDSIVFQCDSIENAHPGIIVDWKQSDEPFRSTFLAHGVVNDSVRNVISAGTTSPLYLSNWNDNPYFYKSDLFVKHAKPPTLEVDFYVFVGDTTKYGGKQGELDTLASYIEASYQACQITPDSSLDLHFTAQAFAYWDSSDLAYDWRHPTRGEIFAEVFIALAHGAKGINFFKYTSYAPSGGDSSLGLVDYNYSHTNPPFSDRWQAVHNIFTQIDTMETTLLALERDTAFCVYGTSNAFKSPLSDVYFEDDDDDYIEVGQFHDSSDVDYLIIVNRRTDYDRHITIETDLTGSNALLDLYTQERFVSSTGNFKSIPFDSGEGRVFKVEEGFNDWD